MIRITHTNMCGEGGWGSGTTGGGPISGGPRGRGAPNDRATGGARQAEGIVMRTIPECAFPSRAEAPARAGPAPRVCTVRPLI
jgi:hypothetical protein